MLPTLTGVEPATSWSPVGRRIQLSHILLAHLELQVSLCNGLFSVVRPLSFRPSLAFHVFNISSRTISWIELKLSRRHCSNMEIQNCWNRSVPISKTAATSDWVETGWEASQWYRDSKLLKLFVLISKMVAILKFFKRHLLLNPKSDWAETWWEASQWYRDSKLLNHSDIQDGCHGGHLEILQTTSPPKP